MKILNIFNLETIIIDTTEYYIINKYINIILYINDKYTPIDDFHLLLLNKNDILTIKKID